MDLGFLFTCEGKVMLETDRWITVVWAFQYQTVVVKIELNLNYQLFYIFYPAPMVVTSAK